MIPAIPPAVCAIGLVGSLLLGSIGLSNLAHSVEEKPKIQQTANWNGLIKGIIYDYNKAKKQKKSIWLNVDEKKFEKAFGIKPNKTKK